MISKETQERCWLSWLTSIGCAQIAMFIKFWSESGVKAWIVNYISLFHATNCDLKESCSWYSILKLVAILDQVELNGFLCLCFWKFHQTKIHSDTDLHGSTQICLLDGFRSSKSGSSDQGLAITVDSGWNSEYTGNISDGWLLVNAVVRFLSYKGLKLLINW
jgi:hypothetical protein